MKKIFIYLTFILSFVIKAQEITTVVKTKYSSMIIPDIRKENVVIPQLNTLIKNAKSQKVIKGYTYRIDDDTTAKRYSIYKTNKNKTENITYIVEGGFINLIIKSNKDTQTFTKKTLYRGHIKTTSIGVQTQFQFYKNGNVKRIIHFSSSHRSGYPAGTWYAYSENGDLLRKIDHEKHFRLNYYDLENFADQFNYSFVSIGRGFNDIHSYWFIYLAPDYHDEILKRKTILVDDKTSEIIYIIDQQNEPFLNDRQYDKLNLSDKSLQWLLENDAHQIPDTEYYKIFRE